MILKQVTGCVRMLVVNPAEEIYKRNKGQVVDQIETRSANEGKTEKYLSFKIPIHPINEAYFCITLSAQKSKFSTLPKFRMFASLQACKHSSVNDFDCLEFFGH